MTPEEDYNNLARSAGGVADGLVEGDDPQCVVNMWLNVVKEGMRRTAFRMMATSLMIGARLPVEIRDELAEKIMRAMIKQDQEEIEIDSLIQQVVDVGDMEGA